jgi:hypothetical protein
MADVIPQSGIVTAGGGDKSGDDDATINSILF